MSAREYRSRRWERWNTRPGQRALASRYRRERFTSAEVDTALEAMDQAAVQLGRQLGERDTYEFLAELLDDPTELTCQIGSRALHRQVADYLDEQLLRRAREANPEKFARLAEIIRDHDLGLIPYEQYRDALAALTREIRPDLWPSDGVQRAADDLLDVADAVGATPDAAAEEAQWWADPDADDPGGTVVDLEQGGDA
ncbi:hypothetical protein [Micromonospora sp. HUAS LYJ1]|uniref:hypothetical protein n=1 Tax=Micromonospora sp. HUAS LYJ1 TaxID=3061626 RepID=UPI002672F3D3|nr:hypothetical protein [Micromonospora sp. HUAS LYJ1]WKU03836.1 hypothetical protein Q2K16_23800 [Micromonospora sp. HUAS LYJ1]